jgi:hypothetical protein
MLGFADLMLDCWLEVSLHLEGLATGQFDQVFPWFSLVPERMLSWYQKIPRCTACFSCSPLNGNIKNFACTNVTLTLGWITLFMGDMGDGSLHREDEVTVKQRN